MGNSFNYLKWQEPSTPLERTPELSNQESTSLTSNPRVRPQPPEESREHTDSDQVPSHSGKSEDSKNPLNSSSESFLSKDSSKKSPTTSRPTSDSNHLLSLLFKKPLKPTWSASSRTPTFAPSTPRELPSCQRTCNSPEESEVRDPEHLMSLFC